MSPKVLVVDDELILLETLQYNLKRQGYAVCTADNGLLALEMARTEGPDLILLDVLLPRMDGLEVCRILRQEMSVPILMLTAKTEEVDKVVGLEVGADDYVTKPFSMHELLARVKALLRRTRLDLELLEAQGRAKEAERLVFSDLVIDVERREVFQQGVSLPLKPKEFDLLLFLARNRGIVLSRDLILERVWGWHHHDIESRTVDVHMRWLRERIEQDPTSPVRIVTIRGVGYRFEG
jgi:DNA-binding response OmpR family regulator